MMMVNMLHPQVSVIMSIYNEPMSWIKEAILSILNQTYSNFEFIIINDNPFRVENKELLDSFLKIDDRIITITNEQNIGLTKSLNKGIRIAKGKYIARMDADDVALEIRLEKQYAYMDKHDDYVAVGGFAYIIENERRTKKKMVLPTTENTMFAQMFLSSPFIHSSLFFRNIITYDEEFKKAQDYKLAIELCRIGKISNLNIPLLYYRKSEQQITFKSGEEQKECAKRIRRIFINRYYKTIGLPSLYEEIVADDILKNEQKSKLKVSNIDFQVHKMYMNSIRRVLYCSLKEYPFHLFIHFLFKADYLKYPYSFKRFVVILFLFFKIRLLYKLL